MTSLKANLKKNPFQFLGFEASRQVGLTITYFGRAWVFLVYPSTLVSNDPGISSWVHSRCLISTCWFARRESELMTRLNNPSDIPGRFCWCQWGDKRLSPPDVNTRSISSRTGGRLGLLFFLHMFLVLILERKEVTDEKCLPLGICMPICWAPPSFVIIIFKKQNLALLIFVSLFKMFFRNNSLFFKIIFSNFRDLG